MSKFREHHQAKNRLLAHYKNASGTDLFPIQTSLSIKEIDLLIKELDLQDDEFLITEYPLIQSFRLLLTSRRLILKRDNALFDIKHEDTTSVFLKFPFKKEEPPHELSLITKENILYVINFLELTDLVEARNEIYRVINTVIIDWRGEDFDANKTGVEYKVVDLPASISK